MERNFHGNGHDRRCKYDQKTNQDNGNLDDMNYILETHKEQSDSLTYEHYMVGETKSRDIQKHAGNHSQVVDETEFQMEICFIRPMSAYD